MNERVNRLRGKPAIERGTLLAASCALCFLPLAANAYVGPGAGLSLLGALWALVVAIGAAVVFLFAWPIRRMRRRKREAKELEARQREAASEASEASGGRKPGDAGRSAPADARGGRRASGVQAGDLNEPRRP